ncbi:MAG: hypothetical protein ABIA62_03855 [Candidatus Woesearchaeota archaeon]
MTKKKANILFFTSLIMCTLLLMTACDNADKGRKIEINHVSSCGDGICSDTENQGTCPQDCSPKATCGDDTCDETESYESCPDDCEKLIVCGDDDCDDTESYESCPDDCKKPSVCGDGTCDPSETCGKCARDCACKQGYLCVLEKCIENKCSSNSQCDDLQMCYDSECVDVVCKLNADCKDDDACTRDRCAFAGNKNAYCNFDTIKDAEDNDGCCPRGYECGEDDDCCTDSDNTTSEDDGWVTGKITMPPESDGDHLFFDFSAGMTTTDTEDGDIYFNLDGDLMGECSDGECAEVREEDALSFTEMIDPPTSGYGSVAENINDGQRFWVRTLEGDYAKIYITGLDYDSEDDLEYVDFRWGYQE